LHALPIEAQVAPVRTALVRDFDGDGKVDLLLGGNFFAVTPAIGRYDASYGQLLHGLGDGRFTAVDLTTSGLVLEGQVRHLAGLRTANGETLVVAARNDTTLQLLHPFKGSGLLKDDDVRHRNSTNLTP
jgi:enediyne biosynthesis protein E4